ncbi:MAG: hypothetical protein KZQ94_10485 [Candidatus Thiodiazotropha sp. (ex Troendleina suluensis)]|nr:hypothetical protein [Candidatus Thiodiazotropha sp. (ex Troendleina suluensis)]
MAYFHIVVETKSKNEREAIFTDLSKSDVKKVFVTPYLKGNDLFINGTILPVSELTRICIVSTDQNIKAELKLVQEKSSKEIDEFNRNSDMVRIGGGWGWKNEEIEDYGKNVTSMFLNTVPGSGTKGTKILGLLNHPLLIRVGGGLLLLVIGGLIGKSI